MRWVRVVLPLLVVLSLVLTACGTPSPTINLQVRSDAFDNGGFIPTRYTCDGEDISPPLTWSAGPPETQTYLLLVRDPDAPGGTFIHWVLYNIPRERTTLPEAVPPLPQVEGIGMQGTNDFGPDVIGYRGPCPPPGKAHRYYFTVYALNATLSLAPGASARAVRKAMKGHVLTEGTWMGKYKR